MLYGKTHELVEDLRQIAQQEDVKPAAKKALTKAAGYFERNEPRMHYDQYLAAGWPIATGVIEGACRHFIKDRMERSGMRWTRDGAQAMLDVCSEYLNGQ